MKFVGRIFAYKQDYGVTREVRVMKREFLLGST